MMEVCAANLPANGPPSMPVLELVWVKTWLLWKLWLRFQCYSDVTSSQCYLVKPSPMASRWLSLWKKASRCWLKNVYKRFLSLVSYLLSLVIILQLTYRAIPRNKDFASHLSTPSYTPSKDYISLSNASMTLWTYRRGNFSVPFFGRFA